MLETITLWPSTNQNQLVDAIAEANRDNKQIRLMPGRHLTKPGYRNRIPIGKNGLTIKGTLTTGEYSSIERPGNAIDLERSDSNYGLFFIPAKPTDAEWRSVKKWRTHRVVNATTGAVTTYKYAVLLRGKIKIENTQVNCNMGNQGLPASMPSEKIEHSAMIGFSGEKYANSAYPNKFIFVGFESVTINNVRTIRGGYADDIWISRGYFRPNIGRVIINKVASKNRVNQKRATISFSGLTQKAEITNCNVFRLEAEEASTRWNELPGPPLSASNKYSFWKLRNVSCERFDLAAKGKAIFMDGDKIRSTVSTNIYQLGGKIQNSIFHMLPEPTALNRLNELVFRRVNWVFTAFRNTKGNFTGLSPRPQYGETCSATFIENTFKVRGNPVTDAETEWHSLVETENSPLAGNSVDLTFRNCRYDGRFGVNDKTVIGKLMCRGRYKFRKADFNGIPVDEALLVKSTATINTVAGTVHITIP